VDILYNAELHMAVSTLSLDSRFLIHELSSKIGYLDLLVESNPHHSDARAIGDVRGLILNAHGNALMHVTCRGFTSSHVENMESDMEQEYFQISPSSLGNLTKLEVNIPGTGLHLLI
jgi:hypothetical protein